MKPRLRANGQPRSAAPGSAQTVFIVNGFRLGVSRLEGHNNCLENLVDEKRLNCPTRLSINVMMRLRLLRIAMISLMALLWMAQAGHCSLQSVPGLGFLDCAGGQASESGSDCCCAGQCKSVEARQQKTEARKHLPSPRPEVTLCLRAALAAQALMQSDDHRYKTFTDVPPEFPKSWQFFERTALSPRAPSIAS